MNSINFFKLWHLPLSSKAQFNLPGEYINLEQINCPDGLEKIWPYLQEYRVHFADLNMNSEYVGFISASFEDKFGKETTELLHYKLNCGIFADFSPIVLSQRKWFDLACLYHTGIEKYINYYCEKTNINNKYYEIPICYCNSFICKTEIYKKFKIIFQKNIIDLFKHFDNNLNFNGTIYNDIRKGGCLCERLVGVTLLNLSSSYDMGIATLNTSNFVQ